MSWWGRLNRFDFGIVLRYWHTLGLFHLMHVFDISGGLGQLTFIFIHILNIIWVENISNFLQFSQLVEVVELFLGQKFNLFECFIKIVDFIGFVDFFESVLNRQNFGCAFYIFCLNFIFWLNQFRFYVLS